MVFLQLRFNQFCQSLDIWRVTYGALIMYEHISVHNYGLKLKWTIDILQSCQLICRRGILGMLNYFIKA